MTSTICIFEDSQYTRLLPLAYLRPVYDLRCGILTLREKIERAYAGVPVVLHCREYLEDAMRERNPGVSVNEVTGTSCLFVNGRAVVDGNFAKAIPLTGEDAVYTQADSIVAVRASAAQVTSWKKMSGPEFLERLASSIKKKVAVNVRLVDYPWHLVNLNGECIRSDFELLIGKRAELKGKIHDGVHLLGRDNICVDEGSSIMPGVVLDAEPGPIYIGKKVTIMPNAVVEGPAFIGDGSIIKIGAKIYGGTSIGPMCKVGGEVEGSTIHSYSNKQHDGFLGHSYLCQWCNLGADTNNSDLKNNYSNVRVMLDGEEIDTGLMFVGLIMGDHSKSGINTMFNTGTVVGINCNVFGAGFPPKSIPSFSWGGSDELDSYGIDKAVEVARVVMGRRKQELTSAEERLLRTVHGLVSDRHSLKQGASR